MRNGALPMAERRALNRHRRVILLARLQRGEASDSNRASALSRREAVATLPELRE